jgi:succinate-semialdehyde dehydrogenase/glutarate-semialdehyde dehydrogenase
LGASVFTADTSVADQMAARLETGQVFVNGMVASDPRYPFGGVKDSGFGRELGPEGFVEFVNAKLIRVMG